MKYQIRDIADLLNISKQMVRYYEENGIISPKRMEGNNYRLYDVMDYFALGEAISLSKFSINIKDIQKVKNSDYTSAISERYRNYIKETENELAYKSLLKERAQELLDRTENAELNVGNIWVKRVPEYRLYPLVESHNDTYGDILVPKAINLSEVIPFGEGMIELEAGYEKWWSAFQEKYARALEIPFFDECIMIPEHYSACMIINMGEIGEFDVNIIKEAIEHIHEQPHIFEGKPRGLLLCRGVHDNEFHRLLEIQVPIRKP